MKKTIAIITSIIPLSFVLTGLYFAYRYMWFSTETIPPERILVAVAGSLISLLIWGFYVGVITD